MAPQPGSPATGFQALILCGPGLSLNTFTSQPEDFPKALIPVANRPMIWYPLEWCSRMGITSRFIPTPASDAHCILLFSIPSGFALSVQWFMALWMFAAGLTVTNLDPCFLCFHAWLHMYAYNYIQILPLSLRRTASPYWKQLFQRIHT